MIRINLLPPAQRKANFRMGLLYAVIASIVLCMFGFSYAYYSVKVLFLENDIERIGRQYELERPTQGKMVLANEKNQQIVAKQTILNDLSRDRTSWALLLSHLSGIMTPEVWLTELTGEKNVLHIKGGAADYVYIAKFLKQLEQDSLLSEPMLVNAQKDDKQLATEFEITVKLKGL